MVLLSIVCTAVLSMVMSQSRYVGQINTDVQMLDQVRSANELMSSEIADLPRGAIQFARRDSISYRLPVMWGIVCGPTDRQAFQAKKTKLKKGEVAIAPSTNIALNLEPQADVLGDPSPEGLRGIGERNVLSTTIRLPTGLPGACLQSDNARPTRASMALRRPRGKEAAQAEEEQLPPPPVTTVIESLDDYLRDGSDRSYRRPGLRTSARSYLATSRRATS